MQLISSEYPETLITKIKKKQDRVEALTQQNHKLNIVPETTRINQNLLKEIQTEAEIKKFYEEKCKNSNEALKKNKKTISETNQKIEFHTKEYKQLKAIVRSINLQQNTSLVKSSNVLKKLLIQESNSKLKSLRRFQILQETLTKTLKSHLKQEKKLNLLLSDMDSFLKSPHYRNSRFIFRSVSQPRFMAKNFRQESNKTINKSFL